MLNRIHALLAIGVLAFALVAAPDGALAQAPANGTHYVELSPPQPTETSGKIEVIEFFWYGCPHCYALEPMLEPWVKKLPKDAVFKRVPAVFNEQWGIGARVFYALDAIGEEERVRAALFDAIHKENLRLTSESAMEEWLGKKGVSVEKYKAAYKSFGVESRLRRAMQMTQAYKIDGVPTFAVQGRYVISATLNNDRQRLLAVTEYLIGEARRSGAKK
ncbi:MAG: thiol:disulfide interchange protein DsbA/DsbL [Betaproteobacteria bacterium]|nr:thiol:disulfide interchange protein DsbA/DsbL [Betaproteobacteria bacterium]